jgi:PPE-repeat protein
MYRNGFRDVTAGDQLPRDVRRPRASFVAGCAAAWHRLAAALDSAAQSVGSVISGLTKLAMTGLGVSIYTPDCG